MSTLSDLDPKLKAYIDNAAYGQLLSKWRNAPIGNPFFQGEIGDYYAARMAKLRDADPAGHVTASKNIGW